jgi:hypothetical protein
LYVESEFKVIIINGITTKPKKRQPRKASNSFAIRRLVGVFILGLGQIKSISIISLARAPYIVACIEMKLETMKRYKCILARVELNSKHELLLVAGLCPYGSL